MESQGDVRRRQAGDRLREVRMSLGLTQKELSRYLGYSSQTCLRDWEANRAFSLNTHQRKMLHVDGVNLLFIDVEEGDYIRDGFTHPGVRENILKRISG